MKLIGIDTGGTFTDFVLLDGSELRVHKVLSTPEAPERAILRGIEELGLSGARLGVVHGSTVATNAVLERKGVRTAYIGNRGLKDLLSIGRQARRALYDLQPPPETPPVPPELCLEVPGRLGADGKPLEPLTETALADLRRRLQRLRPRAVAINLLYCYLDDSQERAIEAAVPEGMFVSRASAVLPVTGEFERGIATWINAWVGPLVAGYIERLRLALPAARVAVMQSSGEAIAARQAARQAVRMLLSGPAGGLVGARFVGRLAGRERLLSFDMGGTSTDVALIDGEPQLTMEGFIGPYPVAVPMVDMHTIGAGGGSIAWLDAGGMLRVGPESAGAAPGPACYGRGGERPTVTDANLVLGRLRADAFLGGRMRLHTVAAREAMERLASAMDGSCEQAAQGVIRIANEHMARALRVISVQRGADPRHYTLASFGGAGGMHVCALAEALAMRRAMVPVHAGVLSALGMLASHPGRRLSRTWLGLLDGLPDGEIEQRLQGLEGEGRASLIAEGVKPKDIDSRYSLDLRYRGQSYTLNVPWRGRRAAAEAFAALHEQRYGHCLELPVELVNLRVAVRAPALAFSLAPVAAGSFMEAPRKVRVLGIDTAVPVFARERLLAGAKIGGPAIVTETVATTWLAPGWTLEVDAYGNLLLEHGRG